MQIQQIFEIIKNPKDKSCLSFGELQNLSKFYSNGQMY